MDKTDFEKTLQVPMEYWGSKKKEEVRKLLGSTVAEMVAFDQKNPHHCYDLFLHTLHTIQNVGNDAPSFLLAAAFLHDIGKPKVAVWKTNRLVFYGHAKRSEELAGPILRRIGYSEREIKEICFYISHHDDFIPWVFPEEQNERNKSYTTIISVENLKKHIQRIQRKYLLDANWTPNLDHWKQLLCLCRADVSAQAEYVYKGDVLIASRSEKVRKIDTISECLEQVM